MKQVSLLLAILLSLGCSTTGPNSDASYTTIAEAPGRNSEEARALHADAIELIAEKEYERAEVLLKQALATDVVCGPAHNSLGKVYYHQDKLYLAAWEFQYAIKLMPKQPEPKNNLGLVFEKVGKLDEAVENYEEAWALAPDDPQVLGNLARARVRRGDRGEEMKGLLEQVVLKDTRVAWTEWARKTRSRNRGERSGLVE